ncbi:MAG TPA: acetyl-CoA carboxylase biotin carboxyl carrier protein [Thermomicrobiales bacterium]|jgi:acetyl-CoA carboxylase biotin carboxyl carrier protein
MAQNGNGASDDNAAAGLPSGLTGEVRALIEMMSRGGIAELSLQTSAVKLRLRTREGMSAANGGSGPSTVVTVAEAPATEEAEGTIVPAPMLGTFYRAPGPGEPDFVDVGEEIAVGQTIGIIEAMKIMNEIAAETGGTIVEFLVESGQPVEYGQPLLRLMPAHA